MRQHYALCVIVRAHTIEAIGFTACNAALLRLSDPNPIETIKSSQPIKSIQLNVKNRIDPINRITSITLTNQSMQPPAKSHCL